jgi:hypothetical protein
MHEKQLLPWETQLGDIGETEIKSRLQRFSTVTKIERDVGIDFYCELIINGKWYSSDTFLCTSKVKPTF